MSYSDNPSPYDRKEVLSAASRMVSSMYLTRKRVRTSVTVWRYDGGHNVVIIPDDDILAAVGHAILTTEFSGRCCAYLCISGATRAYDGARGVIVYYGNMYGERSRRTFITPMNECGKVLAVYPDADSNADGEPFLLDDLLMKILS